MRIKIFSDDSELTYISSNRQLYIKLFKGTALQNFCSITKMNQKNILIPFFIFITFTTYYDHRFFILSNSFKYKTFEIETRLIFLKPIVEFFPCINIIL